jgi:hypothetical protein
VRAKKAIRKQKVEFLLAENVLIPEQAKTAVTKYQYYPAISLDQEEKEKTRLKILMCA